MYSNSYTADGVAMANLIANNIYDETSSICELVADYYDADATKVEITFDSFKDDTTSFINQITITGDGDGMSELTLLNLMNLGSSNKINRISPKFNRSPLGSFGIAFASILRLGDSLDIYTRCSENNSNEVYYANISNNDSGTPMLSSIKILSDDNHYLVPSETGTTLIIKNCTIEDFVFAGKITKSSTTSFDYLRSKLALLPIHNNFSIVLQSNPISRLEFPTALCSPNESLKNTSIIDLNHLNHKYLYFSSHINILGNILPFHIYYKPPSSGDPFSIYERGIRLSIHERLIDYNYLEDIKGNIPSPGAYSTRVLGIVHADCLFEYMNASRDGLVNSKIHLLLTQQIATILSSFINKIKSNYKSPKTIPQLKPMPLTNSQPNNSNKQTDDTHSNSNKDDTHTNSYNKDKRWYQYQQRLEFVKNRIKTPNTKLKELGIQFCYNPNNEPETFCLISQLCQLNLLPFKLLECASSSSPDSIIGYLNDNDKFGFMEIEHSLGNFFTHDHSIHNIDTICCWHINHIHLRNEIKRYLPTHTEILDINVEESCTPTYSAKLVCILTNSDKVEIEILVLSRMIDVM